MSKRGDVTKLSEQLDNLQRKVDFDSFDITVKELVSMVGDRLIDISPDYQRHFRWKDPRQSALVESIFLGIPVPSLFMAANKDGTWEVIDGLQRLSTLVRFVGSEEERKRIEVGSSLKLKELEKLTEFEGCTFENLPDSLQRKFILKRMRVTTITDKSDKLVRFDLFKRLNTGGVELEDQEIRHAVYRGKFVDHIKDLASRDIFRRVVNLKAEGWKDGTAEEWVLRFFAYYHNYREFGHRVDEFLNDYINKADQKFDYESNTKRFEEVFSLLAEALPDGIKRGRTRLTPANVYEAVSVGAALALDERETLVTDDIQEWVESDELRKYTSAGSNTKTNVRGRIEFMRDRYLGK